MVCLVLGVSCVPKSLVRPVAKSLASPSHLFSPISIIIFPEFKRYTSQTDSAT